VTRVKRDADLAAARRYRKTATALEDCLSAETIPDSAGLSRSSPMPLHPGPCNVNNELRCKKCFFWGCIAPAGDVNPDGPYRWIM
jgi:hypothetical protein